MKRVPPLVAAVASCLRRLGLQPAGVVAVSGGPDSVALLRALVALRRGGTAGPLVVAHLNHRLRGAEADADEEFVRELHGSLTTAGAWGVALRTERIDVAAARQRRGGNLEAVARRLRYDWLAQVAAETGSCWVATGHTADDQAETVLHRLLRGAGLKGLRGIAPRRPLAPGVEVVRPLLAVTRPEVLAFLESEGQAYRQDSSNLDLRFTRNRIRQELLPRLAEYNPAVVQVLAHLAQQAAETYRDEEAHARALLAEAERPRAGAVLVLDRRPLAAAPRRLVREALRLLWEREGWPTAAMGFADWERFAAVALGEAAAVDLPGGCRVRCRERVVQIGPDL